MGFALLTAIQTIAGCRYLSASRTHSSRIPSRILGIVFLSGLLGLGLAGCGGGGQSGPAQPDPTAPTIPNSNNPSPFVVGIAGTYTFVASGVPAPTLNETGALPAVLTFTNNGNGTATLSGTPAAGTAGTFPITITASNGVGSPATQNFTLTVNQPAAITSANSATFVLGSLGSFTVTATGSPAPTLSQSGNLPAGVTFSPSTGVLSGTPTSSGSFPISFTAHNGAGSDATQNFTLTVNQSAAITSANNTIMTVGVAASFSVTATGVPAPSFTESGALPSGVLFNAGTLAGTPGAATAGTYPITITAHNGVGADATQNFTLTVNQPAAITSANTATFVLGSLGSFTLTATGLPAPTLSESGALPTGVGFTAATGVLAGTPAAGTAGNYPITFTAHNGVGTDATQSFTLIVPQAPAITSANNTTMIVGVAASFSVTATGAPAPSLTETGALPSGVLFNAGTLAGTPAPGTAGTFPITITASNGVGSPATQNFTLTVNQPAAITSANTATFVLGSLGSFTLTATGLPAPTLSESGALPTGVGFTAATGVLAGTPAAGTAGNYPITFTAHNAVGADATQSFTLIVPQAPAITSPTGLTVFTFVVGTAGTFPVTATGAPVPTLTETGALPSTVTFIDNKNGTGTLSGTPAPGTVASYPITITAHNGIGADATQSITLTVTKGTATVTLGSLTQTYDGTPKSASAATVPVGLAVTFSYSGSGGTVYGPSATAPVGAGTYAVTGNVSDSNYSGSGSGTLTIGKAAPSVTWTTPAAIVYGTAVSATQLNAAATGAGGTALSGAFVYTPAAGTLVAAGSQTLSVTFTPTDTTDYNAVTKTVTLVVNLATPTITWAPPAPITYGTPLSATQLDAAATGAGGAALPGSFVYTPAAGTVVAAGSQTLSVTFTPTDTTDYSTASKTVALTVDQPASFTSANNVTFTVGAAGSFTVSATGFPATTLSESGALPSGVTFNSATGALAGTPAAGTGGSYPVTFTAHNGIGTDATQAFTLNVDQILAITSANSATLTAGTLGSFTVTTTGWPAPTFSESGNLPAGLALNSATGVISGTPTSSGVFPISFTAHNGVGADATQNFTLTVKQSAAFTSANNTTMTVGVAGSFSVTVLGYPAPTLSEAGALPSGVHLTAGTLAGTPAAGTTGIYPITITAHNGVGADATQSFMLTVNQAPAITSANAATFDVSALGSFTVTATGSPAPSLGESGALPGGVTFNNSTGELSGTPATGTAGSYSITFSASNGVGSNATQNFTLTVGQTTNAPSINSPNNTTFSVGSAGSFIVTATGSPTPTLSESGLLPSGVTFNASTGTVSGTPAVGSPGTYHVTFTAANGVGTNATQSFTLTVDFAPSILTQPQSQTVSTGQTANFTVAVTGSAPLAYQWQKNGVDIGGATSSAYTTPVTTANDNGAAFTVVISNPVGSVTSSAAILTVDTPPTISVSPANQTVAVGETATFTVSVSETGTLSLTYQWLKNNGIISGATSASYTTPASLQSDNGDQISVKVSNSLGTASSNAATLTVSQPASPATYYVDFASGADTNSGLSKSAPWRYAPGMNSCASNCAVFGLRPGDKVIFKGGVTWDVTGFPMIVSASGASGNPIYFGVDQTWFAGNAWSRPAFDLSNSIWQVAPVFASSANFVTFDNLEIKNEEVDNSGLWPPRGSITVNGGSNITIQNCYIHGWSIAQPISGSDSAPTGGIAFYNGSSAGAVQNCVLDGSPESDSGIGIFGGTSIQQNVIENVPNGIVITDPAAIVSGNQVFEVPYSVDPSESSSAIFAFTSGSIDNNIVHDLAPGASALYLEAGASETGNTQHVYNNLVWNVGDTAPIVIASDLLGSNSTSNQFIYNNTLSGGTGAGCISVNPNFFVPTNLTVQNNHCISELPASQAWCWNQAGGSFDCGSVTNATFGNNVLMTTEIAASGGYTLSNSFQPTAPNSATVGVGLNLVSSCVPIGASLCSDRLGVVRPGGSTAWDAGAYQYQSVAGSIAPTITQQPVHQEATAGQTATFSVVAAGSATLNYQWQQNGTAISGATSSTYTSPATSVDGTLFTVVVSNTAGSVTSSPALLSVSAAPGQLTPSPATGLNFGTVNIGTAIPASVTLTNTSADFITISNVSVAGSGFSASGIPSGIILAPGEAATLNAVFAPSGTGTVTGSVAISSDAAGSPTTIPLSGTGINPPHSVNLSWNPDTSAVFGYYLYRATNQYGPYLRLNSTPVGATQYTDITVVPGQTYIYWVTGVASDTIESPFSDSATVVVPTP
jgi:hypothetical protein